MEIQTPNRAAQSEPPKGHPPLMTVACLAISIALIAPLEAVEVGVGSGSRLAICSMLWVAVLSLPQAQGGSARWSVGLGLGLCVLGLAASLDLARGLELEAVVTTAWPTAMFLVLLPAAAARAQRTGAAGRHAVLWCVLVAGAPLLVHALGVWGRVDIPGWLAFLSAASPLDWLSQRAAGESALPWLPIGVAVLLFSTAAMAAKPEGEEDA